MKYVRSILFLLIGIILFCTHCSLDSIREYNYKYKIQYRTLSDSYKGRFKMRLNAFREAIKVKPEILTAFDNGDYKKARSLMRLEEKKLDSYRKEFERKLRNNIDTYVTNIHKVTDVESDPALHKYLIEEAINEQIVWFNRSFYDWLHPDLISHIPEKDRQFYQQINQVIEYECIQPFSYEEISIYFQVWFAEALASDNILEYLRYQHYSDGTTSMDRVLGYGTPLKKTNTTNK